MVEVTHITKKVLFCAFFSSSNDKQLGGNGRSNLYDKIIFFFLNVT